MKLRTFALTAALKFALIPTPALAGQLPPTFVATDCPTPPVCNTQSYVYPGTIITPTSVAKEVTSCIDWRSGNNTPDGVHQFTPDEQQCFGAFQDIISLQDCDAAAFNYLYYNPDCAPKPIRNGLPGF